MRTGARFPWRRPGKFAWRRDRRGFGSDAEVQALQASVAIRQVVEVIDVLDERGKRVQVTAAIRIETARDPDGFVEHTKVPQEVRAPDGELLSHDNLRAFVGQHSRKRFTRADF